MRAGKGDLSPLEALYTVQNRSRASVEVADHDNVYVTFTTTGGALYVYGRKWTT